MLGFKSKTTSSRVRKDSSNSDQRMSTGISSQTGPGRPDNLALSESLSKSFK